MSRERWAAFKIAYYHTMHTSIPQCSVHEKVRCFAKMCNIKEHKEQDSKSLKYMTFIILTD